jgi:alpha-beta hydrolase superfamily lysophospholipase
MAEQSFTFTSKGLKLSGAIRVPDGVKPGERRPAFIVLHGFGSRMIAENVTRPCAILDKLGYVTMRFDMPGCGESEGEKGLLLCLDQVQATSDALTLLAQNPNVDPLRIAILGSSFGAAVVVYTGAIDLRVAAVVSASGWGDGERKFQRQHPTSEAWAKFTAMLEEGRGYRERAGKPLMVPRYDIVPIPEHLRTHVVPGSVQMFAWETARSMYDFRANEVVAKIAPRPLLLLHSSDDHVTPVEQSIELFQHAGQPTELHLFADTDHFMFAEGNTRVHHVLQDWLANYFPVEVKTAAA